MIISCRILIGIRNLSGRNCRENKNKRFMFNNLFFFFENRAAFEIMWKNMVEPDMPRMRNACWIDAATDTHSKCVIFIAFFATAVVTLTPSRLGVTLYVHCSSCYNWLSRSVYKISFLAVQVIFFCVYITNYLHFITMFLSFNTLKL